MTLKWAILDTGVKSASENIALDSVLLEAKARGEIPNILRFLQFSPSAVLVGYHQTIEQEVRVEFCRKYGIDINRRITGGGAIYFDKSQLGWEIVASKDDLGYQLDKVTERVCEAVVNGLRRLGLNPRFRPRNDIEINGRKISGTGGIIENSAVLFQGTLMVDFDVETMIRALRIPTEKLTDKEISSARERVTCLQQEMGKVPPLDVLKQALQEGFEDALGIDFGDSKFQISDFGLSNLFEQKKAEFDSQLWVESTREPISNRQILKGTYKAKAGLIRVSLVVDIKRQIVKQSLITGDFFISPCRTIFDLESWLKDIRCDEISHRIERFFENKQPQMTGLNWTDFAAVFLAALEKVKYLQMGISLKEANHLFTINGALHDILRSPSILLLPYCAKLVKCKYRNNGGCDKCGKCSVGTAYRLAQEHGLTPITIQNYEHLKVILQGCKKDGVKSYIGCCCETFFAKRQKIFREAGIPGVLIDIENSTCYDLDKESEALNGRFENQTGLRLGLLEKVINYVNRL